MVGRIGTNLCHDKGIEDESEVSVVILVASHSTIITIMQDVLEKPLVACT